MRREALNESSHAAERCEARPGEVRDVSELQVGRRYLRHIRDQVQVITVCPEPAEWQGSIQVVTVFEELVALRGASDLGKYVMVEINQPSLHRRNPQIPPTIEDRVFLADIGLESSSEGNWNQWNYLEKLPEA